MSFVENTAFQPRVWNNRNDDTKTITGRYYSNASTAADCSAGWLCTLTEIFETGVAKMMPAADGTVDALYVNYSTDVPRLKDNNGNLYAVGSRTLGLGLPAGRNGAFARLDERDIVTFSEGNLTAAASTKYLTPSNGQLTPVSAKPTSGWYFELLSYVCEDMFTEGNIATMSAVTVRVCRA